MQVWSTKGNGQMKYGGHCCNFIRETANIVNRVPLLPQDLDVLVLRPKDNGQEGQEGLASSDYFRVRRRVVEQYIKVLQRFHPSFRNGRVTIDLDTLRRLPDDENVYNQVRSVVESETPQENPGPNDLNEADNEDLNSTLATNGFAPQLGSPDAEMAALESGLNVTEAVLTMPQLHPDPIDEHNTKIQYMIDAFPILFPTGAADFHMKRPTRVKASEYFTHLIRYRDGRFATDPRFRYFALNSIMRWEAKERSRIFASTRNGDPKMTVGITNHLLITDVR